MPPSDLISFEFSNCSNVDDNIMIILREKAVGFFIWIATYQVFGSALANPNSSPAEDLQEEYYDLIPTMTDQFTPQDEKDAKVIYDSLDSDKRQITIAGIISHREKMRRFAINVKTAKFSWDHQTRWISELYSIPQNPFDDCCFALTEKEATVLGNYLEYFIQRKDKQRIGFVMVLTKDVHDMATLFESHFGKTFLTLSTSFEKPYKTMITNWASKNREPLEKGELNQDSVTKDANALNKEHNDGWKETRTQLDCIFFQKSIKYARAVIKEFEKLNNGKTIENIISTSELDDGLTSTYLTFAQYIKKKHQFIAEILLKYSDGSDNWAVWNMCMAVIHPKEWSEVDEVFKKCNKGTSLTKFITESKNDKIMAEMMALIIDPSFKPTQF